MVAIVLVICLHLLYACISNNNHILIIMKYLKLFICVLSVLAFSSCGQVSKPYDAKYCSHCNGTGRIWPSNRFGPFALLPGDCPICDGRGYYTPIFHQSDDYNGLNFKGENSDQYIPSGDVYLNRTDIDKTVKFKSYKRGYNTYVKDGGTYVKINGVYRVKIGSHHYFGI